MDEYVSKETIQAKLNRKNAGTANERYTEGWNDAILMVKSMIHYEKSAEVAPVRHGKWVRIGIKGRKGLPIYPCCSACGMVSAAFRSEWEGLRGAWKYCPNCGAKMDGGAE